MQPIRHIKSLQAFSVVARTQNLTHAAQRMNVSQSSVSYHIKKLEDEIGTLLFDRSAEGLRLTEKGRSLAEHVERGLAAIRAGLDEVGSAPSLVRLAVLPMFASRWLSGRLGSFWEEHPGLELAFQTHDNNYVSMKAPDDFADLGIQWGRGGWPGFTAVPLWTERMVIVCSADFLKRHTVEHPTDLMTCPLLHVDDHSMWEEWFANVGMEFRATQRQTTLVDRHFQLASTANGLGVSLFAESMVQSELRSGSLVNPFGCSYPTGFAYHLVFPDRSALGASAQAFKTWLLVLCENTEPCLRSS
ncbi:LysR substrate-binding domain-containing protein [Paracoccus sp. 1_MG-2023]|uniref:LysR substrate-binding domain-containing protein n=1 Tax=unclassified Paracoccus (in: a-proteobacteria) TaxID=2688777 RepID=UPI001C084E33|nr:MULTISPECIES: LysR substrate-binding domain-containing protein [unclassified Paracoccus (in: a-proteobacteria)]MBU2959098.1 LysR family transcriptional regulator [Paracoccus sp. C2R09]MDO6669382.1 LysR substrate-binding domain-containing protein [Paracoccus sp. 1_MG-2023]